MRGWVACRFICHKVTSSAKNRTSGASGCTYEEFLPKIRAALTEATQVVASGRLSIPITATYKPFQIKEAIEHYQRGGKVLLDFTCAN